MKTFVKLRFNAPAANMLQARKIKIRRADHTGDSCLAMVDPTSTESIAVGDKELNEFWQKCISEFGKPPAMWAGRVVENERELKWSKVISPMEFDLTDIAEVLVNAPLVGG